MHGEHMNKTTLVAKTAIYTAMNERPEGNNKGREESEGKEYRYGVNENKKKWLIYTKSVPNYLAIS